jgi:hypothetical protein
MTTMDTVIAQKNQVEKQTNRVGAFENPDKHTCIGGVHTQCSSQQGLEVLNLLKIVHAKGKSSPLCMVTVRVKNRKSWRLE